MELTPVKPEMTIVERTIEYQDAIAMARDAGHKFIIVNTVPHDSLMVVKQADGAGYSCQAWLGRIGDLDRLLFRYRPA